jgi:predicted DNA-binding ribbon-helix-helix protein
VVGSTLEPDFAREPDSATHQQGMSSSPKNSPVIKRSVILHAHKTSVSLEQPFWLELKSIVAERKVLRIGSSRRLMEAGSRGTVPSALRVFVLAKYRPEAVDTKPQHHASEELLRKGPAP